MSSQSFHDPWDTKPALPKSMPDAPHFLADELGLKAGDRLGSYELLARLGEGGMGLVFRVRHVRLKKEFALKVLSPRLARDREAILRFERETEALGRLEHVNLVRASDAGVEYGVPYVVMELLDGMNLAELTHQRGAWTIPEACEAVRQAALGLQHAFERGLVHRDIKPSNLWLTPEGVVKVLDMGLARLCGENGSAPPMTFAGAWMGTPDYIAPEQILDSHTADIRADLYSLGCTLFHLLSGEPPFGPSTHPDLRQKSEAHLKEPPPKIQKRRPDVSADLETVLARLLAKRPQDRYQTPAEAAAALAPFASGAKLSKLLSGGAIPAALVASTRSEKPTTTLLTTPFTRSHRSPRWIAIVLLLALVVGPCILLVSRERRETIVADKLQVLSLEVTHHPTVNRQRDTLRTWPLGKRVFSTNLDDSVTVKCRLSLPAYAFLISFRPDGTPDVCFPEEEDEVPQLTDEPQYPSKSVGFNYGLQEGTGLQVFALVASSQPLPSFKEWWAQCSGCPWKKNPEAPPGIVWRSNGIDDVEALTENDAIDQRAKRMEVQGKTPVAQLAKWLLSAPQVEAVQVVGFAVMPKDKR